ncbi:hypothetical protein STRDD10_01624 [Streptococcus sp. DD10]|uniref:hypothetical protein n=1 Tax=Streptococcus sp. DD10 TaxID=1777878 RepID=UPI0007951EB7|nr:hypothetical protein [Streptococcus sp. DD10]KXT73149.1 hypothetical protein STRDD10_01624 [Streptococcus sp. DD10]
MIEIEDACYWREKYLSGIDDINFLVEELNKKDRIIKRQSNAIKSLESELRNYKINKRKR